MKKRKKPVLLVTLLIVMLGVVFAMNYRPDPHSPGDGHDHGQETPVAGEARENTPTAAELAARAKPNVPPEVPPQAREKMGIRQTNRAAVEKPRSTIQKPVPNNSSTSTQWYTDEARKPFVDPTTP